MLLFKCFDIWLRIYIFIKHIVFISPDNLIISNLEFPMLLQEPSGLQYFWKHIIWKSSFKMLIFFKKMQNLPPKWAFILPLELSRGKHLQERMDWQHSEAGNDRLPSPRQKLCWLARCLKNVALAKKMLP